MSFPGRARRAESLHERQGRGHDAAHGTAMYTMYNDAFLQRELRGKHHGG
jgi:hypothetical protein